MGRFFHLVSLSVLVACGCILAGTEARASDLYLQGELAISGGLGESGGTTPFFPNSGDDWDSSPVFGGALGYQFLLSELLPLDWDTSLPRFPMRIEFEGVGGRDYELVTDGGDPYLTSVSSWAVLHNMWLAFPLHEPISWALGRVPLLEPLSFNVGGGVGLGGTKLKTTNNVFAGKEDALHLTWQVGGGFGYRLTDRVSLDFGYRFVDLGSFDYALFQPPAPDPVGNFTMDLQSHEFRFGLRVSFYTLPPPGSWGRPPGR